MTTGDVNGAGRQTGDSGYVGATGHAERGGGSWWSRMAAVFYEASQELTNLQAGWTVLASTIGMDIQRRISNEDLKIDVGDGSFTLTEITEGLRKACDIKGNDQERTAQMNLWQTRLSTFQQKFSSYTQGSNALTSNLSGVATSQIVPNSQQVLGALSALGDFLKGASKGMG